MLSFGWSEIALTVVIVIIVVGPKEIPNLLKQLGTFSKSLKKISRDFKKSLNEIADQSDLKEVKKSISEINDIKKDLSSKNIMSESLESINKTGDIFNKEEKELDKDVNKVKDVNKANE